MTKPILAHIFQNAPLINVPSQDSHSKNRSIEVLSIVPSAWPGVIAVVTVKVGSVVINQVRVSNRGRGFFVDFPARKIDGQWVDLVTIVSPALRAAVVEVILATVREWTVTR